MLRNYSDEEVLMGLKNQESWAFKYSYENHFKYVLRYVTKNSGNIEDAKDIFQDMFVVLINMINRKGFQLYQGARLHALIISISKKIWLKRLNMRSKEIKVEEIKYINDLEPSDELISRKIEKEKKLEVIAKLFKEMSTECQKLLHLYYFEKIRLNEIAIQLDYTMGFVRVKKLRCLKALEKKYLLIKK